MNSPTITRDFSDVSHPFQGKTRLFSYDEKTGQPVQIRQKKNLILYMGADIMAQVLGSITRKIDYLFFEFTNGSVPGSDPLAVGNPRAQGIGYYNLLSGADYLRVPLEGNPIFEANVPPGDPNAVYLNNSVTFNAMTAGFATGRFGTPFTNGTSKVYGVALASKYDEIAEPSKDIVFSRNYFIGPGEPITKQANQQVAAFWSIIFY